MADSPLFDARPRDDPEYRRSGETTYAFLDRVSRPELAWPREVLNAWFERWPADDREELRARLVSKSPAGFDGAFWELYLHELHAQLGFTIERDPRIADRGTRPDFLMRRNDETFYLEATVAGLSDSELATQRREREIAEMVSQAYHPDFSLRLQAVAVGDQMPARRVVVAAVEKWMRSLNWEEERAKAQTPRPDPAHIEVRGTHLLVSPWPRKPSARGDRNFPTVVTHPSKGGVLNEPPMILDDLKDKASKFGHPKHPYVIALLCARDFTTHADVEQALYGPEVVHVLVGPNGPTGTPELGRNPRGFWQHDDAQRATRVSAVLSAVHLSPWSVRQVEPQLWLNPWATRPLQADLPWAATLGDLASNRLIQRPAAVHPAEVLKLADNDG